jgi:hypothetical protein
VTAQNWELCCCLMWLCVPASAVLSNYAEGRQHKQGRLCRNTPKLRNTVQGRAWCTIQDA